MYVSRPLPRLFALPLLILIAACGGTDDPAPAVTLYDDLGDYGRTISTESADAQAYFDQGLRLQYAFNHPEALRAYEYALEMDPDCAMCWWGIALASGPNINAPMDEAGAERAVHAIGEAMARLDGTTDVERGLIEALATRFGPDPLANRVTQDSAWAAAMTSLAVQYPNDPDVLTLATASLMNLSPWHYWTGPYNDRVARPGTAGAVEMVETALTIEPDHPGACHYLIHAVEAAYPERAVQCADRLAELMPGAGHIVHMPGHIYLRVGRYADAVEANRHAVHADETYIADLGPINIYTSAYYPHNYHFLNFAATMAGMSEVAVEAGAKTRENIATAVAQGVGWIQMAVATPQLTGVTFGRWDEVLAQPAPDASLPIANMLHHYARGVAHAALGNPDAAGASLDSMVVFGEAVMANPAFADMAPIPQIARHALAGEIELRSGSAAAAVEHFAMAKEIEDQILYSEPPLWYYPIRWSLGEALLQAGQAAEAEVAYRENLEKFPGNGWALYGLAKSLEAQGKTEEAEVVSVLFDSAWESADIEISASRM
jgi:tetratricopeptide (TPR) repeat protein